MNNLPDLTNPDAIERLRDFVRDAHKAASRANEAAQETSRTALGANRPLADEVNEALYLAYIARNAASDAVRYANRLEGALSDLGVAAQAARLAADDALDRAKIALATATAAERAAAIVAALEATNGH